MPRPARPLSTKPSAIAMVETSLVASEWNVTLAAAMYAPGSIEVRASPRALPSATARPATAPAVSTTASTSSELVVCAWIETSPAAVMPAPLSIATVASGAVLA